MRMGAFNQGAVELVEMLLGRGNNRQCLVFSTILTSGEEDSLTEKLVRFLVYRPNSYTKVYVDDDRARGMDDEKQPAPWHLVCDHDSCWRDWFNYGVKGVDSRSEVKVKTITLRTTGERDNDNWFFNPSRLIELLDAPTEPDVVYTPEQELTGAAWYGYVFDVFCRDMARRKHDPKTLHFEIWAHKNDAKGGVNRALLCYDIKAGLPVLTGIEYGRKPQTLPAGGGTGTIQGDVVKYCWSKWKEPRDFDMSIGCFTNCGVIPFSPWGL